MKEKMQRVRISNASPRENFRIINPGSSRQEEIHRGPTPYGEYKAKMVNYSLTSDPDYDRKETGSWKIRRKMFMPARILKFRRTKEDLFKVEIWGDSIKECGTMRIDEMMPFLNNLNVIAATTEEVLQWLRESKEGADFLIEQKRKHA
jgi:hypothetical protein